MKIVCFNRIEVDGEEGICGAVQMTGFQPGKHTLRSDLPCRGCGEAGHYDGVGDDWTSQVHNGLPSANGDVEPVRNL